VRPRVPHVLLRYLTRAINPIVHNAKNPALARRCFLLYRNTRAALTSLVIYIVTRAGRNASRPWRILHVRRDTCGRTAGRTRGHG